MFGIGAYDGNAVQNGAAYAYSQGWTTPAKAIEGGAAWIAKYYVYNSTYRQDTLYKMRWNPEALVTGSAAHQYATDVGWAVKQTPMIDSMYSAISKYSLIFDVPEYAN
jgi:mannosyl-glycoprotein endo-beta-N-acetylglucosaminidase